MTPTVSGSCVIELMKIRAIRWSFHATMNEKIECRDDAGQCQRQHDQPEDLESARAVDQAGLSRVTRRAAGT
jgi:hypothetical protein